MATTRHKCLRCSDRSCDNFQRAWPAHGNSSYSGVNPVKTTLGLLLVTIRYLPLFIRSGRLDCWTSTWARCWTRPSCLLGHCSDQPLGLCWQLLPSLAACYCCLQWVVSVWAAYLTGQSVLWVPTEVLWLGKIGLAFLSG